MVAEVTYRATEPTSHSRFHVGMAAVFVLIAFGSFTPTYWSPVIFGPVSLPPIVHLHGALLFSWTLLYLLQTGLVASGRLRRHQAFGLFGIALFSLICCSILATRLILLRLEVQQGFGEAGRRFSALALCSLPLLIGFFAAAIANNRRPEIHRRLMYLLMVGLMIPALARIFLVLLKPAGALGPPPPVVVVFPTLTAALLIVVAMVRERRQERRIHPVTLYGGLILLLWTLAIVPFSSTPAWLATIHALEKIAG